MAFIGRDQTGTMTKKPTSKKTGPVSGDPDLMRLLAETMPYAYALFDAQDRLVLFNSAYRKHSGLNKKFLSGLPAYEDILRKMVGLGRIDAARKDPEAWLKWRIDHHRNPAGAVEVFYQSGRVLLINEQRLENGYTSSKFEDVTDLRSQQRGFQESSERARVNENQLQTAIESMSDGFAIFDARGRLVICNSAYQKSPTNIPHQYEPGQSYRSILDACAMEVFSGTAKKERNDWIKWRISRQEKPGPPADYLYPDGRWVRYSDFKTADGNHVVLSSDITEQKKARTRGSGQRGASGSGAKPVGRGARRHVGKPGHVRRQRPIGHL